MARLITNAGDPRLKKPPSVVEQRLSERIDSGERLSSTRLPIGDVDELRARRQLMYAWNDYNHTLLKTLFSGNIMAEYTNPVSFGGADSPQGQLREFEEDRAGYLRQPESIKNRLPLWAEDDTAGGAVQRTAVATAGVPASLGTAALDGPIFVVHGRDSGRKNGVARVLEKATDRKVVILHEQANRGRTLLEKFEQHAQEAAFAVVRLTADDEGQQKGKAPPNPRGRQNVIFELGFFFAALGRERVMVLLDPNVEQPSDVRSLVYEEFDAAGAWKQQLARELEGVGVKVDRAAIP